MVTCLDKNSIPRNQQVHPISTGSLLLVTGAGHHQGVQVLNQRLRKWLEEELGLAVEDAANVVHVCGLRFLMFLAGLFTKMFPF